MPTLIEDNMTTQSFTLIIGGRDVIELEDTDKIYAVCDDCTAGSRDGRIHIRFHREAGSLEAAIRSAIDQIQQVGYVVTRVETAEYSTVAHFNEQLAPSS